eukprot:g5173.t1
MRQTNTSRVNEADDEPVVFYVLKRVVVLLVCFGLCRCTIAITILSASKAQNQIHNGTIPETTSVGLSFVGQTLGPPVSAQIMQRMGRVPGIVVGCCIGVVGSLASFAGVYEGDPTPGSAFGGQLFGLIIGSFLQGVAMSFANQFRFFAAELVPDKASLAIGLVLAGGDIAALLGPECVIWFTGALSRPWSANYLCGAVLFGLCSLLIQLAPRPPASGCSAAAPRTAAGTAADPPRPLREIMAQPRVLCSMACAMIAYSQMVFLMVMFPLVMHDPRFGLGFTNGQAAHVYQAHSAGMFTPPLVLTPFLLKWNFGQLNIIGVGFVVFIVGCVVQIVSETYAAFIVGMFLVGVGWNLVFVAATTMLISMHSAAEKARVQGANDALVWGTTAVFTVFSSDILDGLGGWRNANILSLALCVAALLLVAWMKAFDPISCEKRAARGRPVDPPTRVAVPNSGLYGSELYHSDIVGSQSDLARSSSGGGQAPLLARGQCN